MSISTRGVASQTTLRTVPIAESAINFDPCNEPLLKFVDPPLRSRKKFKDFLIRTVPFGWGGGGHSYWGTMGAGEAVVMPSWPHLQLEFQP